MPIKFKKTNIQYDIDTPEDGYIVMGFDEDGNLVTKNSSGDYEPIINDISTGNFERLEVDYLTVGNRVSGVIEGRYSIAQGLNISATGDTSYAQGNVVSSGGLYSYARGEFVSASGELAYAAGRGSSSTTPVLSSGINSFVHMRNAGGSLANDSAILGGISHSIGTDAIRSAIIGGASNTVNASVINSVVLGGLSQTATNSNAVYVPRLVLTSTSALSQSGAIYYDGTNFYGYNGSTAKKLDYSMTVTSPAVNRMVTTDASGNLIAHSTVTWSGSLLNVTGAITLSGNLTANGNIYGNPYIDGGYITSTRVDIQSNDALTAPTFNITNSGTGDVSMLFDCGTEEYTIGVDHSDSEKFKIYYGTSLGTSTTLTVFETEVTSQGSGTGAPVDRNSTYMNGLLTLENNARAATTLEVIHSNGNGDNTPPPFVINRPFVSTTWYLQWQAFYVGTTHMGGIYTHGSGTMPYFIAGTSDIRNKHDINIWEKDALAALNNIDVKTFYTNDDTDNTNINIGWVAQDLLNDIPEMVKETGEVPIDDPDNPYLTVAPSFLTPYFHKAIKQLNAKIEGLEQRIYNLENPV